MRLWTSIPWNPSCQRDPKTGEGESTAQRSRDGLHISGWTVLLITTVHNINVPKRKFSGSPVMHRPPKLKENAALTLKCGVKHLCRFWFIKTCYFLEYNVVFLYCAQYFGQGETYFDQTN